MSEKGGNRIGTRDSEVAHQFLKHAGLYRQKFSHKTKHCMYYLPRVLMAVEIWVRSGKSIPAVI